MLQVKEFERRYFPKNFKITAWADLKPYADDLLNREWSDAASYRKWLEDSDEFGIVCNEEYYGRYTRMTCNTESKELQEAYQNWVSTIATELSLLGNALSKRFVASPYNDAIKDQGFDLLLKRTRVGIELFRDENVPISAKEQELAAQYGEINGAMTVTLDGETLTLAQAAKRLEWSDRTKREEAWHAFMGRRYQDKDKLDILFDDLLKLRVQIAKNAEFENYRDYKFKELQRFDYTPKEALQFHDAIEKSILPLVKDIQLKRQKDMGLEGLRPWDLKCDPLGRPALIAFENSDDLVAKTIKMLDVTAPFASEVLCRMKEKNMLDLDSRKGKAPGGYNVGFPEKRCPFMFMNHAQSLRDVVTCVHETGHAAHDHLTFDMDLYGYKSYPMEVAELASMSLELLTHDQWHVFFPNEDECRRARYTHLKDIIEFFPHMARIDAFQHQLYLNPNATAEQRHDMFDTQVKRFGTGLIDWTDLENDYSRTSWQAQLHIYEVPFYYIEYGIAQLGALQVWRNYKQDKKQAVEQYKNALALGYTKSIPEIYETAGIKFDFSAEMIKDLMDFVGKEMKELT